MKKKGITEKQKRFLIIWCCIHAIALLVNYVRIPPYYFSTGKNQEHGFWTSDPHGENFWPFTTWFKHYEGRYIIGLPDSGFDSYTAFYGFFNSYGLEEFFIYIILGFAIVYIPKLW